MEPDGGLGVGTCTALTCVNAREEVSWPHEKLQEISPTNLEHQEEHTHFKIITEAGAAHTPRWTRLKPGWVPRNLFTANLSGISSRLPPPPALQWLHFSLGSEIHSLLECRSPVNSPRGNPLSTAARRLRGASLQNPEGSRPDLKSNSWPTTAIGGYRRSLVWGVEGET